VFSILSYMYLILAFPIGGRKYPMKAKPLMKKTCWGNFNLPYDFCSIQI